MRVSSDAPETADGVPFAAEVNTAIRAARAGGDEVRRHYATAGGSDPRPKADGSPVTAADLASDASIRAVLGDAFPEDAILTEEGADDPARLASRRVWIVDPLDGTKQFVARTGDFDVLVALVLDGLPVVAAAHHPPSGRTVSAVAGHGAWADDGPGTPRRPLRFAPAPPATPLRVVTSIWYGAPTSLPTLARVAARGGFPPPPTLDTGFAPRYWATPTGDTDPTDRPFDAFLGWVPSGWMAGGEWDLVVTDLIVREAGGVCTDLWGRAHRYNKPTARNVGGMVIASDPASHDRLLVAVAPDRPEPPPDPPSR